MLAIAKNSDMNLYIRFSVNMRIFMGLEDFWRIIGQLQDLQIICTLAYYLHNFGLFAQLQIICTIADYLRNCRFLDLVLFLHESLQDFWRVSRILEDSQIIWAITDYLQNCRLFVCG